MLPMLANVHSHCTISTLNHTKYNVIDIEQNDTAVEWSTVKLHTPIWLLSLLGILENFLLGLHRLFLKMRGYPCHWMLVLGISLMVNTGQLLSSVFFTFMSLYITFCLRDITVVTKAPSKVDLLLVYRLRRWPNIKSTLRKRLVFTGMCSMHAHVPSILDLIKFM